MIRKREEKIRKRREEEDAQLAKKRKVEDLRMMGDSLPQAA